VQYFAQDHFLPENDYKQMHGGRFNPLQLLLWDKQQWNGEKRFSKGKGFGLRLYLTLYV
jgi:hypothetical protein